MNRELTRALAEAQNSPLVRDLLSSVDDGPDGEGMKLCSLLSIHLLALAGTDQALLDTSVLATWTSLNMIQKRQVRRLAMQSFLRTEALAQSESGDEKHRGLVLHPHVALIMMARTNPRFALTLGNRNAARGLRVFAIDNTADSGVCYIMEKPDFSMEDRHKSITPLDWYYSYWLLPRPFLATYLANYSAVPSAEDTPFAGQPRILSLYRPPVTDKNMVASLEVLGAGSTAKVLHKGPGAAESAEARDMSVEELAAVVSELLAT